MTIDRSDCRWYATRSGVSLPIDRTLGFGYTYAVQPNRSGQRH